MIQENNNRVALWVLIVGLLVGLTTLITFGIDLPMWRFYGALYNEFLVKPNVYALLSPPFNEIRSGMGLFIQTFHKLMIPVYDVPGYYMIVGVIFKMGSFAAVYFFLRTLLVPFGQSLIFSTFFCLFSTAFAQAGGTAFIIGGVAPLKATLAGIFTLLGLSFGIRKRLIWSAICFGLSIQFHLFCGATGIIFSVPFLLTFNDLRPRNWSRWFAFSVIIISGGLNYLRAGKIGSDIDLELSDWYLILKNFGDTYMLDSLVPFISILATNLFLLFNFRNYKQDETFQKLERATLYSLLIIPIAMFFDHAHDRGFFLGPLSEIFVVLEVRRGLWIPSLALAALVWKKLYGLFKLKSDAKYSWLLFAVILLVAQRYNLIMSIALVTCLWLARQELDLDESSFWKAVPVFLLALIIPEIYRGTLPFFSILPLKKLVIFLVLYLVLFKSVSKVRESIGPGVLTAVLLTHLAIDGVRTFRKDQGLIKNLDEMQKYGVGVWEPITMDKIVEMSILPRKPDDIPQIKRFIALGKIVQKYNPDQTGMVWSPITEEPYYFKSPFFFDPFWSMYGSYYSRVLADGYQKKTRELYNLTIKQLFNGSGYYNRIEAAHNSLPEEKVVNIMKKYNVRFLLSKAKYISLKQLGEAEEYFVYELAR